MTVKQRSLTLLLLCLAVSAAGASDGDSSLLACGINFGGNAVAFSDQSARTTHSSNQKKAFVSRPDRAAGTRIAESIAYIPPKPVATFKTETRLPPKMTFATLGCSWR